MAKKLKDAMSKTSSYMGERNIDGVRQSIIAGKPQDIPPREKIQKLIQGKKIKIINERSFRYLLDKLWESELELLYKILQIILNKGIKFHIEVYDNDSDLQDLCISIYFPQNAKSNEITNTLSSLYMEKERIDPNNLLWFVGFVDTYNDY